jgi:hypothetical protein
VRLQQQHIGTLTPPHHRHMEGRRDGQLWAAEGNDSDGLVASSSDSSAEGDKSSAASTTGVEPRQRQAEDGVEATKVKKKTPAANAVVCPDCDLCDGSGRIAGGLGAVLPWLPVKAYRPCPNFVDRGGVYQRSGQGLDEIAFGRDSTYGGGGGGGGGGDGPN